MAADSWDADLQAGSSGGRRTSDATVQLGEAQLSDDPQHAFPGHGFYGDGLTDNHVSPGVAQAALCEIKPVDVAGGFREQGGLLGFAIGSGDPLERIEDHLVAALALVRRKVALEHGP